MLIVYFLVNFKYFLTKFYLIRTQFSSVTLIENVRFLSNQTMRKINEIHLSIYTFIRLYNLC